MYKTLVAFLNQIFLFLLCNFFFNNIKIPKNSSAKYYQDNKERLQKRLVKDIGVFLKKKKKKSDNMVAKDNKILPEDEKQKLAEYREKYYKMRKNALL